MKNNASVTSFAAVTPPAPVPFGAAAPGPDAAPAPVVVPTEAAAHVAAYTAAAPDLVCFSHLVWEFVWQRPQHLLSRFAAVGRVFFVEDPFWRDEPGFLPWLEIKYKEKGVRVLVAHLPRALQADEAAAETAQEYLLTTYFATEQVRAFVAWYYTPMALGKSRSLHPLLTVYDCMDELAAFAFAPPALKARERELLARADLVFTGGQSLYEYKQPQHPAVYAFPSSIDQAHFAQARHGLPEPADQAAIPHPRIGFYGVIDERFDLDLVRTLAARRPDWQVVLIGPVVKIDPALLPQAPNVHYLGGRSYQQLPAYLGHWEVAALFFALNESTRFISPTKTPEYLAAGKPVVSTPIRDVVRPYGDLGLVEIASDAAQWEAAVTRALTRAHDPAWHQQVEALLATTSWDQTWRKMVALVQQAIHAK